MINSIRYFVACGRHAGRLALVACGARLAFSATAQIHLIFGRCSKSAQVMEQPHLSKDTISLVVEYLGKPTTSHEASVGYRFVQLFNLSWASRWFKVLQIDYFIKRCLFFGDHFFIMLALIKKSMKKCRVKLSPPRHHLSFYLMILGPRCSKLLGGDPSSTS